MMGERRGKEWRYKVMELEGKDWSFVERKKKRGGCKERRGRKGERERECTVERKNYRALITETSLETETTE